MPPYLCELCFDQVTTHSTTAWDGLDTAVCDDCLAPPEGHAAWAEVVSQAEHQRSTYTFVVALTDRELVEAPNAFGLIRDRFRALGADLEDGGRLEVEPFQGDPLRMVKVILYHAGWRKLCLYCRARHDTRLACPAYA